MKKNRAAVQACGCSFNRLKISELKKYKNKIVQSCAFCAKKYGVKY
jgi:hypothetical protein